MPLRSARRGTRTARLAAGAIVAAIHQGPVHHDRVVVVDDVSPMSRAPSPIAWLVPLALATHGCLVTNAKDFPSDSCPVSLATYAPIEPALYSHLSPTAAGSTFTGSFTVSTCAIGTTLTAIVLLDGSHITVSGSGSLLNITIPPTNTSERVVNVAVPMALESTGCHRIDVLVSSQFQQTSPQAPVNAEDLAKVSWYVDASTDGSGKLSDCIIEAQ
jgi:hypothetical protein